MKKALFVCLSVMFAMNMGGACEDSPLDDIGDDICGPCGTVANGDATISGDASIDGFFKAVGDLNGSFVTINASYEGEVRKLAAAFDVEGAATLGIDALAPLVIAEIQATLDASIEGGVDAGLKVNFTPPKCNVNVSASFDAQAKCEAKAGCDVDVECSGGEVSFECEGSCQGSCDAECSLPQCTVALDASLACSGTCSGSCSVTAAGACEGTCSGECSGECSAHNADGSCNGACSGDCTGECKVEVEGECSGSCEGSCEVEATAEVECTGDVICRGECSGSCSGGCEGEVTAPKCSANAECEASVDCEAQASASASANAECTPPSLELAYSLNATLEADASAKAEFMGKIKALKVGLTGMAQGMANLKILFDADAAAEIGLTVTPVASISAAVGGIHDAALAGNIDVSVGLIPCMIPAGLDAVNMMGGMAAKMGATVQGQASFLAVVGLP